ncbi:MAG: DUF3795 domain-containing protein [Spirochaetales bacterium]|nr:DUF3795 domain-containing protein [Spirochaetales bacterium]
MEKMIAFCGLDCASCGAYIATMTNDNAMREKIAGEWKVAYNFDFTPQMINCHGCRATDGVQIGHCSQCEMRACATKKSLSSCGACPDYPCKTIASFHEVAPGTADNLRA